MGWVDAIYILHISILQCTQFTFYGFFSPFSQVVSRSAFGLASNAGGRPYQDDRSTAFSTRLPDGTRVSIGAVLDGHHGHQIADLITDKLPFAFIDGINNWPADLESALVRTNYSSRDESKI